MGSAVMVFVGGCFIEAQPVPSTCNSAGNANASQVHLTEFNSFFIFSAQDIKNFDHENFHGSSVNFDFLRALHAFARES